MHRRKSLANWNAAQPIVDAEGTAVPYESMTDALVDLLEQGTPLPTVLCLLVVDLMDRHEFCPLPQGKVVRMQHEMMPDHPDDAPRTHRQIRFRGSGQLLLPRGCLKSNSILHSRRYFLSQSQLQLLE